MTPSTALAVAAVDALVGAGVRHVVLCPGSRSAPLAYALHAREQAGALRLWVRHDERVAGFTALGMGRAGCPAAVVTTSGTAVANLHPAVLEAHHAGIPLVVLSADRPPELRGTWANQTTELQAGLFGPAVRAGLDLAVADARALAAAVARALGGDGRRPGPVHLDLGFDEPLVPQPQPQPPPTPPTAPLPAPLPPPTDHPPDSLAAIGEVTTLERGLRTVVVAGDRAGPAARLLAEQAGWPLLAEPSSGARSGPAALGPYRLLLELPELADPIERAVVFGRPTLSRPVTRLLARDIDLVLVSRFDGWPVPPRPVRRVEAVRVDVADQSPDGAAWRRGWSLAGVAAQSALEEWLDAASDLDGLQVARAVAGVLGDGDVLVAAASNPIRDLDLAAGRLAAGAVVVANRGLSGIDGTLSTATGFALATRRRVRVLAGDLAFLHDLNALLAAPEEPAPELQIVVVNDGGGGVFSLLEYGEVAERGPEDGRAFERLFGTPHRADLAALCRGYGVPHRRVSGIEQLRSVLADPDPGTSVVEVRTERATLRRRHAGIRAAVRDAVRRDASAGTHA